MKTNEEIREEWKFKAKKIRKERFIKELIYQSKIYILLILIVILSMCLAR